MAAPARTVVVIDDHPAFRNSARLLLETEGYVVIGEAGDGASGVAAVGELRPDVVLLDVQLPDGDGFEFAEQIAASSNGHVADVVLVSSRDRSDFGPLLDQSPVRGFISKSELTGTALAELLS
jgi:DNA-binding NarL/FixJ family response regulator